MVLCAKYGVYSVYLHRTGKSALVMCGLCETAKRMGLTFAGGKFDLNKSTPLPLSAFVDAMSSLTKFIMARDDAEEIKKGIRDAFGDEDDCASCFRAIPSAERCSFKDYEKAEFTHSISLHLTYFRV